MSKANPGKGRQRHKRVPKSEPPLFPAGTQVVPTPADEAKMSAMLIELVAPYCRRLDMVALEQYQTLISLAAVAWNAALMPDGGQLEISQTIQNAFPDVSAEANDDLQRLLRQMIARKNLLFSQERHVVTRTKVRATAQGGYEVTVASTTDPAPPASRPPPKRNQRLIGGPI